MIPVKGQVIGQVGGGVSRRVDSRAWYLVSRQVEDHVWLQVRFHVEERLKESL